MPRRLKVTDVNPHVMCTICNGYLVDATAIIECLHAFCRTCIVRYLENSRFCPVCDVQVHKTKPLLSIRSDQTLQDVVYKVVPGLYQNEMQRRREFYAEHPKAAYGCEPEERGEGEPRFFSPKESISLSLHHRPRETKQAEASDLKDPTTRHLSCPAAFTVGHLKKFIHLKFSLPINFSVDVFYDDQPLKDSFTLMDVAYIYGWKRVEPMKFYYTIMKRVPKFVEPAAHASSEVEAISSSESVAAAVVEPETDAASVVAEPEQMEVDSELPKPGSENVDDIAPSSSEDSKAVPSESAPTTSSADVQQMDVAEPEVAKSNSSLPECPVPPVPVAEPTYNSVKVVSTPERNTLLSPTNGFRLKFIHDPELSPKSRSKKSGRKGGRSSRHKSVPVRLARLAPYPPPPSVPVTCLTTQPLQHLPQLTVGKLVPSVITTLAPTFVTTIVSTTSNTMCADSSNPQVSSFLNQSASMSRPVTTIANHVVPPVPAESLSSSITAADVKDEVSTLTAPPDLCKESPTNTKELLSTEASTPVQAVPSSAPASTVAISAPTEKDSNTLCADEPDNSALTNSSDSHAPHVPDSSLSGGCSPRPTTPVCSKEVDNSEIVTSTSTDVNNPVPTIPTDSSDYRSTSIEIPPCEKVNSDENGSPTDSKEPVFEKADKKSESFKISVKNSISAEFSDNDDLGCQPDLVVDEQKMDSSDNEEDDADTALRKKINAIAEKEDEADVTDDTEADSGRASDMSCPARCEEDVGSPMTTEAVTSSVPVMPVSAAPSPADDGHRYTKPNSIDHVIKQLYLQHEISRPASSPKPAALSHPTPPSATPKDESGALDLSTCTRKPGETQITRPKSVANPVLDIKHRQQTYLPAPLKQHTACPPAPKHPTSSLLVHQLTAHHNTPSILQAQLTGNSKHHPLPYSNASVPYSIAISRPSSTLSSPPSYKFPPNLAHQGGLGMFSSMMPYSSMLNMAGYSVRSGLVPGVSLPARSHQKDVVGSRTSFGCPSKTRRLSDTLISSAPPSHCRSSTISPATSAPAHPRTSPSMLRLSPNHRSASPAPSPQNVTMANSLTASSLSPVTTTSHCKPCVPIHKRTDSSSYKAFNKFRRSANLTVFNPDPNGYRQKLVIKKVE